MQNELLEPMAKLTLEETDMLYCDYILDIFDDRLILDKNIQANSLGWNQGDYFRLSIQNGRCVFVKVDPIEKFLLDGNNE